MKVWVIDDNDIDNLIANKILGRFEQCQDVKTFTNPKESLNLMKRHLDKPGGVGLEDCPDLVLLDINMPLVNGFEWLKKLEQLINSAANCKKDCMIFMLTSSINPADKEKANSNQLVAGYIAKPFTTKKASLILNSKADIELA